MVAEYSWQVYVLAANNITLAHLCFLYSVLLLVLMFRELKKQQSVFKYRCHVYVFATVEQIQYIAEKSVSIQVKYYEAILHTVYACLAF
jgi:hypothetical protein